MKVTRVDTDRNIAGSTHRPLDHVIKEWVDDLYWLDPQLLSDSRRVEIELSEGEFTRYEKAFEHDITSFEEHQKGLVALMDDEQAQKYHVSEESHWVFLPGIAYVKVKLV